MKDKSNGIPLTDMSSVGQDSLGYLRPDSNKIDKRQMNGPEFPGNLKPNSSENQNVDLSSDQKYSFGQESQSYIHPTTVKENAESPVSPVSSDGRLRTPRGMKGKRFDSGEHCMLSYLFILFFGSFHSEHVCCTIQICAERCGCGEVTCICIFQ